ncbi:hypothetical protein DV735_g1894, partial [Chaetothyriales sp. CBS 134920]
MPSNDNTAVDPTDQLSSDQALAGLNSDQFSAVDLLNDVLPSLSLSSQGKTSEAAKSNQLQSAAGDIQALLSKLNAHNVRSSSELTFLTDEILRSANRLAYEVEILRGETSTFYDLLNHTLKADIQQFIREEITASTADDDTDGVPDSANRSDPAFISQLRLLCQVKARLESVIAVFGEAMKWPVPPSEVTGGNTLISVSAPELGIQSTEDDVKAREAEREIRAEIQALLDHDLGSAGLLAANKRVEEYRLLARLWKGTSEEKIRNRFVEGLAKMVEDRRRALDAAGSGQRSTGGSASQRSGSTQARPAARSERATAALFRNLARLKDDLYLE